MTYTYALLRSTDTGLVVDFNEKEIPVKITGEMDIEFKIRFGVWQPIPNPQKTNLNNIER